MKEAKIILPQNDNDGNDLSAVHQKFGTALVEKFGGATVTFGLLGLWRDPEGKTVSEPVAEYLVAMNDDAQSREHLREIALRLGHEAKQKAIYIRHANGDVNFINIPANDNADVAAELLDDNRVTYM